LTTGYDILVVLDVNGGIFAVQLAAAIVASDATYLRELDMQKRSDSPRDGSSEVGSWTNLEGTFRDLWCGVNQVIASVETGNPSQQLLVTRYFTSIKTSDTNWAGTRWNILPGKVENLFLAGGGNADTIYGQLNSNFFQWTDWTTVSGGWVNAITNIGADSTSKTIPTTTSNFVDFNILHPTLSTSLFVWVDASNGVYKTSSLDVSTTGGIAGWTTASSIAIDGPLTLPATDSTGTSGYVASAQAYLIKDLVFTNNLVFLLDVSGLVAVAPVTPGFSSSVSALYFYPLSVVDSNGVQIVVTSLTAVDNDEVGEPDSVTVIVVGYPLTSPTSSANEILSATITAGPFTKDFCTTGSCSGKSAPTGTPIPVTTTASPTYSYSVGTDLTGFPTLSTPWSRISSANDPNGWDTLYHSCCVKPGAKPQLSFGYGCAPPSQIAGSVNGGPCALEIRTSYYDPTTGNLLSAATSTDPSIATTAHGVGLFNLGDAQTFASNLGATFDLNTKTSS